MRFLQPLSKTLLIIFIMYGLAAAAQMAGAPQTEAAPPSGWATNSGIVIPTPPLAAPPTAPNAAFVSQSNVPVGATNATGANLAGATDSTIGNVPGISFASSSQLVTTAPPGAVAAPQGYAEQAGAASGSSVITTGTFTPGTFNPGVGQFSSAYTPAAVSSVYDMVPSTQGRSLAEIAAENRARVQEAGNTRLYTNQDIEHINQQTGGMAALAATAGSMNTGTPPETQPAVGTGTAARSPFAPPVATEQPQATQPTPETGPGAEPPAASGPTQKSRLPATATFLPLLFVLGILAGAAGLFSSRYRAFERRSGRL